MNCRWCHNPEGKKPGPESIDIKVNGQNASSGAVKKKVFGSRISVAELMTEIKKDEIFYEQSKGGVTFSGGEPMQQIGFLLGLLQACKNNGFHTALDTAGYAPFGDFEKIYKLVDLFLYDIKLMSEAQHILYTDVSNKLIFENLERLSQMGNKVMIRIPLIPGITDTDENLDAIMNCLQKLKNIRKISLLPYNKLGEDKLRRFDIKSELKKLNRQTILEIDEKGRRYRLCGYDVKVGG